ncbi:hypothetical protein O9Z70_15685 [Devosia sp. YIM 151766]|nr:hypothetical protein [Devosia sp. YIM 151766]WIY52873.1 hypothetical protein O9Z70_15685 [Devosia sp. YIM 151766]
MRLAAALLFLIFAMLSANVSAVSAVRSEMPNPMSALPPDY